MNDLIKDAIRHLNSAKRAYAETVKAVVLRCEHSHVAECIEIQPEWRICLDCGLTDEGWGCGYQLLRNDEEQVGSISRDRTIDLRTASLWQHSYGAPIDVQIDDFLGLKG